MKHLVSIFMRTNWIYIILAGFLSFPALGQAKQVPELQELIQEVEQSSSNLSFENLQLLEQS